MVDLKAAISGTMCTNSVQMILYLMAEKHFGFPCTSRSTEHVSKGGERCKYGIPVQLKNPAVATITNHCCSKMLVQLSLLFYILVIIPESNP